MDLVASCRRHILISVTRVLLTRGHMVQTQADGWILDVEMLLGIEREGEKGEEPSPERHSIYFLD